MNAVFYHVDDDLEPHVLGTVTTEGQTAVIPPELQPLFQDFVVIEPGTFELLDPMDGDRFVQALPACFRGSRIFATPGNDAATRAYNPDQPRDQDGKWSAGGSGGGAAQPIHYQAKWDGKSFYADKQFEQMRTNVEAMATHGENVWIKAGKSGGFALDALHHDMTTARYETLNAIDMAQHKPSLEHIQQLHGKMERFDQAYRDLNPTGTEHIGDHVGKATGKAPKQRKVINLPERMTPGWKPVMTPAEADQWAKGTVFPTQTFYTGKHAAAQIEQAGFKVPLWGETSKLNLAGRGVYVTNQRDIAADYGPVMQVRVRLKNPLSNAEAGKLYDTPEYKSLYNDVVMQSKFFANGETADAYALQTLASRHGFDGQIVSNGDGTTIVMWNPKAVVVVQ